MMHMPLACEPCHQRKRKCNREAPTCALCQRTSRRCFYATQSPVQGADETPELSVARALQTQSQSRFCRLVTSKLYNAWALQSPDIPQSYPITSSWYMPQLIRHFREGVGVSQIPADTSSTAFKLQTVWVRGALSDPSLFHATLFAGSSHFDIVRGEKPSPITIHHHNELIKLVNDRLSDPKSALDDLTVASIAPLALFADLNGDQEAANIHRAGLRRIVQLRGGLDKLGLDGLTAALIYMNEIIYDIAFDLDPVPLSQDHLAPPLGLESRILNTPTPRSTLYTPSPMIRDLFQKVYMLKLQLSPQQSTPALKYYSALIRSMPARASDDPIYCCCYQAVQIFWAIVNGGPDSDSATFYARLDVLSSQLRESISLTDEELWLRYSPVPLIWVCMTGAAAASDSRLRIWFCMKKASATRLVHVGNNFAFLDDLSSHFRWLRLLRQSLPFEETRRE